MKTISKMKTTSNMKTTSKMKATSKMKMTSKMKTTSKMKNTSKRTGRVTVYVPDFHLRCSESDYDIANGKVDLFNG